MDAKDQLMQKKSKLLEQIVDSAQRGNSQEVMDAGERLKKIESLIDRHEKLLRDISNLENGDQEILHSHNNLDVSRPMRSKEPGSLDVATARDIGRTIRRAFLNKLSEEGVRLENIRGCIYETKSGHRVGIAVATERNPDRWFLGLKHKSFDHAVLLCKQDTGDTVEICLPKAFFDEYADKMSKSGGQMKFNVARRGSGYVILVPGTDGVNVAQYLRDYSLFVSLNNSASKEMNRTLIQSSSETRQWISNILGALKDKRLQVCIVESKYWAAFQNDLDGKAFSHCNPSSHAIRVFLPFEEDEFNGLIPTPSSEHWADKYPTIFTIRRKEDIDKAVDLLEIAYQRV